MIRVQNLCKSYDRRTRVLHDISFTLPETGFVCILGASGCGKTSLLNAIGALDRFDSGTVSMQELVSMRCGKRSTEAQRNSSLGYIFQNYYLLPEHSVAYNVYLGLHALALTHKEKLQRVEQALHAVDMERYRRRNVSTLSGGQQQRVAIARALARRPRVIFADEPTGNLDEANTIHICSLLRRISRTSLVVMVTHETRIASFYADRILRMEDGRLVEDCTDWTREPLCADSATLYSGDYKETEVRQNGLQLRILQEEGAGPVQLTLLALKDRIILKLDDSRSISCTASGEVPLLKEGDRPILHVEELDDAPAEAAWTQHATVDRRSLRFYMLWRESWRLVCEKGLRRIATWLFLAALTVLTLLNLGDYLRVANVDREDFLTMDSHMLEIEIARGENTGAEVVGASELIQAFQNYVETSELEFDYIPRTPYSMTYGVSLYRQMGTVSEAFTGFSYVLLPHLDEADLIMGRMPENSTEIVVDRWVLENMMSEYGILQNDMNGISYFLGKQLTMNKKNFAPTIVGISDSGEPAIYLTAAAMASIGTAGTEVISLSDLKKLDAERFGEITLAEDACFLLLNNAGTSYADRIGTKYSTSNLQHFVIADAFEADSYATMVVADETVFRLLRSMIGEHFYLYCEDKDAMKAFLAQPLPAELEGFVQIIVNDRSTEAEQAYLAATELRLDARSIVTYTVMALSLAMLYLLQRSRVQERIGMMAVYRLLGIPKRKLVGIFVMESLLQSGMSVMPCAAITYLTVLLLQRFPSLEMTILLPGEVCLCVYLAIAALHLLLSVLPLSRLLRLSPAKLAAKYDF